ncbi:alpha/beta fold hydrolase [Cohnella sp. REN36]|uniref:alpha/beta fold hydrolase n=1 Tax=Cohnella sp. REN36 TaxID=2887347 RepID=UPI001D1499A1|nr:alpha/beta hydrolase [Cohnella sp. REN36]MCC3372622.1 alpha/beta hydrolase [Cohnella sp. REN36]
MPYLMVNDVELYVEIEGEGEPVLLIHGLGGNTTQMRQTMKRLSSFYKTIAYDCRGHGLSEKPASYTLEDHIRDALALMDELGMARAAVLGVSGGSYIAQGLAAAEPDRVKRLVLVVARAYGAKSSTQLFFERHAAAMAKLGEKEKAAYFIDRVFAPGFLDNMQPAQLQTLMVPEPALTAEQTEAANRAFEGFDLRPALPRIQAPTLVLSGKYDGLNPPACGTEIADGIPDATFVEMRHSGHAPSFEEPDRFYRLVIDFLNAKGGDFHE